MTVLKIKHFVIFVTTCIVASCKPDGYSLQKITAAQLPILDTIAKIDSIDAMILPYRSRIDAVLDSTLAYAPNAISKDDGSYNTTAGNLLADLVLERANPIYKSRTSNTIDFVLLNHGGIRSTISKGPVSARTAYEVMPFENYIVVVELPGMAVKSLLSFLIRSKRAHPVAGIQIVLNNDDTIHQVTIAGGPFSETETYHIATNDYLVKGGDNMGFFADARAFHQTDYLIRNAIIDYFKAVDTLAPKVDDRFYKRN